MLNQIIRFYNQNRKTVWVIVLMVAFGIGLLHVLNYFAKNNNNYSGVNSSTNDTAIYQPETSLVTGKSISKKTYEKQSTIIDNFIEDCNEGKVEEAYSLLSADCKNILYPSLESFKNNYYNKVFTEKRNYSIENWAGNTYRVNMTHDLLATGKSNDGIVTQDYFTIVDDSKLNINQFIGLDELNKEKKDEHLEVKVIKREKYMDYEIYEIYVKNITNKEIVLDNLRDDDTIYLTDGEDMKHIAYANELNSSLLTISPQMSTTLRLKFANPYIQGRDIKSLTFSNMYSEQVVTDIFNTPRNEREIYTFTISL